MDRHAEAQLRRLWNDHYPELCRGLRRYILARFGVGLANEAEDFVQHAFCQAVRELSRGATVELTIGWLWRVAWRACLSRIPRKPIGPLDNDYDAVEASTGPEELVMDKEALSKIEWALGQLSERERLILRKRYHDGMPLVCIANEMHENYDTVNTWHFRALAKLRKVLFGTFLSFAI